MGEPGAYMVNVDETHGYSDTGRARSTLGMR